MALRLVRSLCARLSVAAVLAGAGWPGWSQAPSKTPNQGMFTISADVELVLLDVSVRDAEGGFVSGLSKDAFTVLEDGRPQPITEFANQDVPVTLGLVVDNSGSMRPKKPDVVTAGLVLIQASNPHDEVFVINFNDRVRRGLPDLVPFTDDIQMLRTALSRTDPVGRTALYDAILAALNHLEMGRRSKKTLIIISDGGDNASTHSLEEVIVAAKESQATLYTMGLFNSEDRDRNPGVLRKLAKLTGGVCYLPERVSEVVDIGRQIAKDIRTRYTIGFAPQNLDQPGERRIKIVVKSPDREKLIARTRTSYVVAGGSGTSDRRTPRGNR